MKRTREKNIKVSNKPESTLSQKKKGVSKFAGFSTYIFLFFLLLSIIIDIFSLTKYNSPAHPLSNFRLPISILAVLTGIISIIYNQTRFQKHIELNFKNQNKIFKTDNFFNKQNILFAVLIFIVIGLSTFTTFYKLDKYDLYSDEISVVRGAAGYTMTGEFKQWDFIKQTVDKTPYNRAKPHQFITALSFKLFGINTWAARFPSALFSVILIIFIIIFGYPFVKDKHTIILTALSVALYVPFLILGRWARMYAMIFPTFFLSFYWTYSFFTKQNTYKLFNSDNKPFFKNYLNFNYIVLPFLLILIYINLFTHQNTTLLFPVFLIFSVFSVFLFYKEKKYLTASITFILILLFQIIFPFKVGFKRFTFFEVNNSEVYTKALFDFPFSVYTNIIILILGLSIYFIIKHNLFRKTYLALFLTAIITWILFSFVFKYAPHFRYISFVTPIVILLIFGIFTILVKVLFSKTIQFLIIGLLIIVISLKYYNGFGTLYETNTLSPAKPSIAYKSISENYKNGDVVFKHWGPKLYMQGISPETKFISLGSYKGRNFADLYEDLSQYKSGWITWHTHNENRIDKHFIAFVNLYFKKYNGTGIDNTGVEVFYFDETMKASLNDFFANQYIPAANLKASNSYSVSFDLLPDNLINDRVFMIADENNEFLECQLVNDSIYFIKENIDTVSAFLHDKKKSNIVWFQEYENKNFYQGVIINGELVEKELTTTDSSLVKFQINPIFKGFIDNVRIFDFALNKEEVQAVIENQLNENTKKIETDNTAFTALYHWKKKHN